MTEESRFTAVAHVLKDAFVDSVVVSDGCWTWIPAPKSYARPRLTLPTRWYKRLEYPHRTTGKKFSNDYIYASILSYKLFHGEIPAGIQVCHKCDNMHCVNPGHLFLGTQLDNIHDCIAKGRFKYHPDNTGTNNGRAKLDWDKVREIRAKPKITCKEFAARFGVSDVAVSFARIGRTWKEKK